MVDFHEKCRSKSYTFGNTFDTSGHGWL